MEYVCCNYMVIWATQSDALNIDRTLAHSITQMISLYTHKHAKCRALSTLNTNPVTCLNSLILPGYPWLMVSNTVIIVSRDEW